MALRRTLVAVLGAGLAGPAVAQTTATTSNDPIVQYREAQRNANSKYATDLLNAYGERGKKVSAAVEAAVKAAGGK